MRERWSVGIAVAGTALAIVAGGCGGSDKLSAKDRTDFVAGCTKSGGLTTPAACGCIYDELRKQGYDTKDKFQALQKDLTAGNRPPSFVGVAQKCLKA
jgi:hypothetical protein